MATAAAHITTVAARASTAGLGVGPSGVAVAREVYLTEEGVVEDSSIAGMAFRWSEVRLLDWRVL